VLKFGFLVDSRSVITVFNFPMFAATPAFTWTSKSNGVSRWNGLSKNAARDSRHNYLEEDEKAEVPS
jgi:hypothetical protein